VPVMSVRAPIRWRMMLSVSTATARKSPPRARMAAAFFMRLLCRFAVFTLSFDRAFVFRAQPFCQEVDGMDRRSLYNLIRTIWRLSRLESRRGYMRKCRPFIACAVTLMVTVVLAAAGCGGKSVKVEFTQSERNPVIIYQRTQALPPVYDAGRPDLIIYGNGTAFRTTGLMDIKRGGFSHEELKKLLTSIVEKGFFELSSKGEKPPLGGDTDHVTVILKNKSKNVSAGAATAISPFKDIVEQLRDLKIPKEQEYTPDNLVLYSSVFQGAPPEGATVLDWKLDPKPLEASSQAKAPGAGVSGAEAQAVWNALKQASGSPDYVYWRAGNKIYARVIAVPQFPMPGV